MTDFEYKINDEFQRNSQEILHEPSHIKINLFNNQQLFRPKEISKRHIKCNKGGKQNPFNPKFCVDSEYNTPKFIQELELKSFSHFHNVNLKDLI